VEEVLAEYNLPHPDVLVADVGTSIYWKKDDAWHLDQEWERRLSEDWHAMKREEINALLTSFLKKYQARTQEDEKQGTYKLSFYTPEIPSDQIVHDAGEVLQNAQVNANVVHSIDTVDHFGYLDILPASADKLHALRHVENILSIPHEEVVYAGDSGNDLEPLTSGCKAIVVNNASASFKEKVLERAGEKNNMQLVYFASGTDNGMNGNYTAGITEGLHHFKLL